MIYIYLSILGAALILMILCSHYKKDLFNQLVRKEHPFRFLYPASARIYDILRRIFHLSNNSKVLNLMKHLYVTENADREAYLYTVKKIASVSGIFLTMCLIGVLLCISDSKDTSLTSLERNDYGNGSSSYELNVDYGGEEETIEITLDEAQLTEEEILTLFENSVDKIKAQVLADNESWDNVNKPLDLITEYENIDISWEIDDTSALDYNGNIKAEIEDGESILINLTATFSIEDTQKVYDFPAVLTAPTVSKQEELVEEINAAITENNSVYEKNVTLPDNINGTSLFFNTISNSVAKPFLLLAVIAAIALFVLYDRSLNESIKKRQDQLMIDYTEIVLKLNLLYEAGLSIYRSWERIVTEYEEKNPGHKRFAYLEMKLTLEKIRSGLSEAECYERFGKRCGLHSYIKLGNLLEQNLAKGTKGLKVLLKQEALEAFDERTRLARKKGEEASTKMLFPMILMLAVVIVIVACPALMSMNF